jgi:threonine/homoserine/homoserine lactone efflux protein
VELLGVAAVSFVVGLSGALSPGPLTVLTIREAARRGWQAGPLATLGHGVVELALVLLLATGLRGALEGGTLTDVIAVAGGLVLLWMGWGLLRSLRGDALDHELAVARGHVAIPASMTAAVVAVAPAAMVVSVMNPYWVIWWATVGAALTAESLDAGPAGPLVFFAGHITSDFVWLTAIAALIASGRRRANTSIYRGLLGACGAFLLLLGALFLVAGLRALTPL